jgi:hypothetical protein
MSCFDQLFKDGRERCLKVGEGTGLVTVSGFLRGLNLVDIGDVVRALGYGLVAGSSSIGVTVITKEGGAASGVSSGLGFRRGGSWGGFGSWYHTGLKGLLDRKARIKERFKTSPLDQHKVLGKVRLEIPGDNPDLVLFARTIGHKGSLRPPPLDKVCEGLLRVHLC